MRVMYWFIKSHLEAAYLPYIVEIKQKHIGPTIYELRIKAYLVMFLGESSMEDITEQATDTQIALLLLALLNVVAHEKA